MTEAKEKKVIYVDIEKCTGCKACMIACAIEHSRSKNLFQAIFESPVPQPRINVEAARWYSVPLMCMHCEKSPCIQACPTAALYRTFEGLVLVCEEYCVGCRVCILACPFGVLKLDQTRGIIFKCDLCMERLKKGLNPACVEACRTKALAYGELEDMMKEVRRKRALDATTSVGVPFEKGGVVVKKIEDAEVAGQISVIGPHEVRKIERKTL